MFDLLYKDIGITYKILIFKYKDDSNDIIRTNLPRY